MATSLAPPLPPNVVAQQAPDPMLQFMRGAGNGAPAARDFEPLQFVKQRLNEVAGLLKDVANVLVVEKPALMPILQNMVQAGSALMNEVDGSMPQTPAQGQMPQPEDTSGAVSMS